MSKFSRSISFRVPHRLDAKIAGRSAASGRTYTQTMIDLVTTGFMFLEAKPTAEDMAKPSPFSMLLDGPRLNGNGHDPTPLDDQAEEDDRTQPVPLPPLLPEPESSPVAARPERIRPPELSQALKSIAYAIIQQELGDCFVGERAILREHPWFVLVADPLRRFNALCERGTREGAGRRYTSTHLEWIRAHISEDPDILAAMAAEHDARRHGQTLLKIRED
jgi:hypothetical protein